MSNTKIKMDWLNQQDPRSFMDLPEIRTAFIDLNRRIKNTSVEEAETFYEKEAMYLKRVIHASWDPGKPNNYIGKCTAFSLYSCFMDMAANGDVLSFNSSDKLCYIEKRSYKAGRDTQGADVWEDRARLIISPYGELAIRQEMGQIAYADPAVVVYAGDSFQIGTDNQGNTVVHWSSMIPRQSKKIIGSFIKITRSNNSYITYYMLQEDIDRLAAYSARQNRNSGPNALYGAGENGAGIDSGFLKAKTLKHALATFPKVKLRGTNSEMDMAQEEDEDQGAQQDVPQGPARVHPQMQAVPKSQSSDAFAPGFVAPADEWHEPTGGGPGVTIQPEDEETF